MKTDKSLLITTIICGSSLMAIGMLTSAGGQSPLDPPGGPVGGTGPSLADIEQRVDVMEASLRTTIEAEASVLRDEIVALREPPPRLFTLPSLAPMGSSDSEVLLGESGQILRLRSISVSKGFLRIEAADGSAVYVASDYAGQGFGGESIDLEGLEFAAPLEISNRTTLDTANFTLFYDIVE